MGLCPEISSAAVGQLEGHLVISLEAGDAMAKAGKMKFPRNQYALRAIEALI